MQKKQKGKLSLKKVSIARLCKVTGGVNNNPTDTKPPTVFTATIDTTSNVFTCLVER